MAKFQDLDLEAREIKVSHPKGHRRWASGLETSPIMPGIELVIQHFLEERATELQAKGLDPYSVDPLFPYIRSDGKAVYWNHRIWSEMKIAVEAASQTRFRWKDLRPTFAQAAKDLGAPIEVVSKALRHTNTRTTEAYYARIRSENAFSQLRQLWEATADTKSIPALLDSGQSGKSGPGGI